MKIGVIFPQLEIGNDPAAIRDWAQAVEGLGYAHILPYDHVLGAGLANRPDWKGPYSSGSAFHEVFVLLGYLAAVTQQVELVIGVLVLPQRQTALVAKQSAALDVLSGGRFRLGVGVGWNAVEYEALNENFKNRGRRMEEQIAVLRELWAKPVVSFEGRYHHIVKAGIKPLPPRGRIPIWMGGMSEVVQERVGRLADGWFPQYGKPEQLAEGLGRVHKAAGEAGRKPSDIGIEPRVSMGADAGPVVEMAKAWHAAGATHLTVNTMAQGFDTPAKHIAAIEAFKHAWDKAGG